MPVPFKNPLYVLSWLGVVTAVVFIVFLGVQVKRDMNTATTTNTVSFSGTGKVLAKADVAVIDLSIVTEATTSKAAQDDNSRKSTAVVDFLKGQGIDEKDIKTTGYNIYPQYDYADGRSTLKGYQVSETITVKVRDLNKTDDVLAGVVSAGANQIGQVQLTIDDPEALKAEARGEAIADAKAKANQLKSQLGIRLGRVVNFVEDTGGVPPIFYAKDAAFGMGGGGPTPEIAVGENEITISVTLTYQIK